ncbi:MAG: hypothetical protein M3Q65_22530, partial [Chloroflexota bacterium]|nr:hypothetical protein [Chloroflexota bacterium]
VARGLAGVGAGLLAALVLALGTPLDLPGGLGLRRGAATAPPAITIVDAGVTRMPPERGRPKFAPWAQVDNRGGATGGTAVAFTIYAPSGEATWSSWYDDARWEAGERKRLGAEWTARGVAPGEYRLGVTVTTADRQQVITAVGDAGRVRVAP